jgi:hypothetical protein
MKELVFLLEERSAEIMLRGILPRIIGPDFNTRFIPFEGKQDLEKQMERKLRGYLKPEAVFFIIRDQDSAKCEEIKRRLKQKCGNAGKPDAVVRIVCRSLESWYLADLSAVEKAFSLSNLARRQDERKFRNPDQVENPLIELRNLVPAYQKIDGSRRIAAFLDPDNRRSQSFAHLMNKLKELRELTEILR